MNNFRVIITDIRKTKRGRYSIYINDEFYDVLDVETYVGFPYSKGDEIQPEELDRYIHDSQKVIAKERALRLLSARSYTARGLKDKLLRDVDEPAAQEIVERMEELGLVDDYDYARRYAADCINLRGFSHRHTAYVLRQRGLSQQVVQKTIEDLGAEDSEYLIARWILKKYSRRIGDEDGERRTINALIRRGFGYNDIRVVLDNLNQDIHYYDDYNEDYDTII